MGEGEQESVENEEWTCGMGLAHHSAIPAKVADYLAALTEMLRAHLRTIDTSGPTGQAERDAYTELGDAYSDLAERLSKTAARMHAYKDLPAAPHHEEELASPVLTVWSSSIRSGIDFGWTNRPSQGRQRHDASTHGQRRHRRR